MIDGVVGHKNTSTSLGRTHVSQMFRRQKSGRDPIMCAPVRRSSLQKAATFGPKKNWSTVAIQSLVVAGTA